MNKNLIWNVIVEDFNAKDIKTFNVLSKGLLEKIIERTDGITDKNAFAEEVKIILKSIYWCRSEWEVVITDWPPHIAREELDRLNKELDEYTNKYAREPYSFTINPKVGRKIDVWTQIELNWDKFIDYIWENLK